MSISAPCSSILEAKAQYGLPTTNIDGPVGILSLDGGGVRGVIEIIILKKVEEQAGPICDCFKVIAGTSTGSIPALALTCPEEPGSMKPKFSARDISDLYMEKAQEIFPLIPWWKKPFTEVEDLFRPPYGPGLYDVLEEYCGDTLLQNQLTEVMVRSFRISKVSKPWLFQRSIARIDPAMYSLTNQDVAKAATAAPTYFAPYQLPFGTFIDGGICDNTPANTAYGVARQLYPQSKEKYLMLSLGTGICPEVIPDTNNNNFGEIKWAPIITNLILQAGQQVAAQQTELFFPPDRLLRLEPYIPPDHEALDDASPDNMKFLAELGDELVEENDELLGEFCKQLVGEKSLGGLSSLQWPRWFSGRPV